jgi:hypothetical protein
VAFRAKMRAAPNNGNETKISLARPAVEDVAEAIEERLL